MRTSGPSFGVALSGATTAEAAAEAPRELSSGAPDGPTSFLATGTMMRPRFCADEEDDGEDDEEAADATIVAERCARITLTGIALGELRQLKEGKGRRLKGKKGSSSGSDDGL